MSDWNPVQELAQLVGETRKLLQHEVTSGFSGLDRPWQPADPSLESTTSTDRRGSGAPTQPRKARPQKPTLAPPRPVSVEEATLSPTAATPVRMSKDPVRRLSAIRDDLGDCQRCKLSGKRKHLVFGVGNPAADLVFIGEAPGAEEDRQGIPFVGKAGQLLTKIIKAMGLSRDDVYICNIIKCRPPQNRDPESDEISSCEPFLIRQVAALEPKVIVTLGRFAAQTLLQTSTPISRLRGRWHSWQNVPVMPTFHPAYLLRNPEQKRPVWEDVQQVMNRLELKRS